MVRGFRREEKEEKGKMVLRPGNGGEGKRTWCGNMR